jgi:pectinesterase inhibitor-like protein
MGGKLLVVTALIGALLIMSSGGADATPETTCKAAAARDKRVDYRFCVSQLSAQNGSAAADAWGLAKAAATAGSGYAGATEGEIEAMLRKPDTDPRANGALGECFMLYRRASNVFATAEGELEGRDYEAAKRTVAEVAPLVRYCDEYFANAGLRSPFLKESAGSVQLAVICAAITDLVGR